MPEAHNSMPVSPIVLIAALPEETKPFLTRVRLLGKERAGGFPLYRFDAGGREHLLLQSGMGPRNAEAAAVALLEMVRPRLIVNFGLGGAVAPGPRIAELVLATRLLVSNGGAFRDQQGLAPLLTERFPTTTGIGACHRGTFITTGETVSKADLRGRLPAGTATPVLEMETAAIARVAEGRGIPLLAVRAISDDCDEELDFTVAEFCDDDLHLQPHKVLFTILKRPRIVPQLVRLARNSTLAAETLATALIAFLELNNA